MRHGGSDKPYAHGNYITCLDDNSAPIVFVVNPETYLMWVSYVVVPPPRKV